MDVLSVREIEQEMVDVINALENWMDEIIDYIRDGKLPEDHHLVRKLVQKASKYTIII